MLKTLSHKKLVDGYNSGELSIYVDKYKAGDFVLSNYADKHNKPAHLFWTWLGILLVVPVPIILLFINKIYAIIAFTLGLTVHNAARKAANQFVLENMLNDKIFCSFVLFNKGAEILNKNGEKLQLID